MSRLKRITAGRNHARNKTGRSIREACGVTVQELADLLGVTYSTLIRWERGESIPRRDAAERWATALADLQRQTAA